MDIVVLYGSELGTAELVADAIVGALAPHGNVSMYDMLDFDVRDLTPDAFHVMVCSTYGSGELPTTAEPFAEALDAQRPDLSGVRFAMFGLGDSVYVDTFNFGGEIIAGMLTGCGATQIGEHARHDASGTVRATDMAREWCAGIIARLRSPASSASPAAVPVSVPSIA